VFPSNLSACSPSAASITSQSFSFQLCPEQFAIERFVVNNKNVHKLFALPSANRSIRRAAGALNAIDAIANTRCAWFGRKGFAPAWQRCNEGRLVIIRMPGQFSAIKTI